MSIRSLRRKIAEARARSASALKDRALPGDVVRFCREWLGYEPYGYM